MGNRIASVMIVLATVFSLYAISVTTMAGWAIGVAIVGWMGTEVVQHYDPSVSGRFGGRYTWFRLAVFTIVALAAWIAAVKAIGV